MSQGSRDEHDPDHTLEACMRKFSEASASEMPARIWRDRDPGDEDAASERLEVFRVSPGETISVRTPEQRSAQ